MRIGDELVVEGVTYVLVDGEKIRMMVGDYEAWICDFCQLFSQCEAMAENGLLDICGLDQNIFVKKLEV